MWKYIVATLILALAVTNSAFARDDRLTLSIAEAYENLDIESQLQGVQMFFGDQAHPVAERKMAVVRTNRKTNAFNKSDQQACEWVFLSTLLSLRDRALQEGGNAVINIKSNYKNQEFVSSEEFQCGAGAIMAGAALIGQIAKIPSNGKVVNVRKTSRPISRKSSSAAKCSTKQILDMKNTGLSDAQIEAACN